MAIAAGASREQGDPEIIISSPPPPEESARTVTLAKASEGPSSALGRGEGSRGEPSPLKQDPEMNKRVIILTNFNIKDDLFLDKNVEWFNFLGNQAQVLDVLAWSNVARRVADAAAIAWLIDDVTFTYRCKEADESFCDKRVLSIKTKERVKTSDAIMLRASQVCAEWCRKRTPFIIGITCRLENTNPCNVHQELSLIQRRGDVETTVIRLDAGDHNDKLVFLASGIPLPGRSTITEEGHDKYMTKVMRWCEAATKFAGLKKRPLIGEIAEPSGKKALVQVAHGQAVSRRAGIVRTNGKCGADDRQKAAAEVSAIGSLRRAHASAEKVPNLAATGRTCGRASERHLLEKPADVRYPQDPDIEIERWLSEGGLSGVTEFPIDKGILPPSDKDPTESEDPLSLLTRCAEEHQTVLDSDNDEQAFEEMEKFIKRGYDKKFESIAEARKFLGGAVVPSKPMTLSKICADESVKVCIILNWGKGGMLRASAYTERCLLPRVLDAKADSDTDITVIDFTVAHWNIPATKPEQSFYTTIVRSKVYVVLRATQGSRG